MAVRTRIKPVRTDAADPGYPTTDAQKSDPIQTAGTVYGPINVPVGAVKARLEIVSEGPNTILDEPSTTMVFYAIDLDLTGTGGWFRKAFAESQGSNGIPPRFPHTIQVGFNPEDAGRPIRAVISNNARLRFGIDAAFIDADGNLMDVF